MNTHQKLKFIIENKVVSVEREEDIIAATSTDAPYVKLDEDIQESSFQSFEFVNATYVKEKLLMVGLCLSKSTHMGLKLTISKSAYPRNGLEKCLQRIAKALKVVNQNDKRGLGFKPSA